jgi:MFS family permease
MKVLPSERVSVPPMQGDRAATHAWQRIGFVLFAVGWGANHFASLLQVYRVRLGLDAAAPALLFGMYALGLVPGLLLAGPVSDRRGRRSVVLPASVAALWASVALGTAGDSFGLLLVGRLLYGLGAGGVMSAGAVWLVELCRDAPSGAGARRATVALSAGFGLGPLVTGVLAQYAPAPATLPYFVHVVLLATALVVARAIPDLSAGSDTSPQPAPASRGPLLRVELEPAAWGQFWRGIAPMAPFVFGFPAIAFAALPSLLGGALGRAPLVYTGLLCCITLAAGVVVQPATRRLEPPLAARLGMVVGAAGLALGAVVVVTRTPGALLAVAPILGTAYGICMTAGLQATQRLARPEARGGITGLYYVLTYVGFAAPYMIALATRVVSAGVALGVTAALALGVAGLMRPGKAVVGPAST